MVIDISQELFSCEVYPGDPAPVLQKISSIEHGGEYNLTAFSMCAHNGTHIDAPYHFLPDGKTVDQIPVEVFVGPAYVATHVGAVSAVDAEHILTAARAYGAGERILIRGRAVVTVDAARVFAAGGLRLIGNESQTFGSEVDTADVHHILLSAGIVLLEGVRLGVVSDGRYLLSAAPLNLGGCDGAPCRAVLITE